MEKMRNWPTLEGLCTVRLGEPGPAMVKLLSRLGRAEPRVMVTLVCHGGSAMVKPIVTAVWVALRALPSWIAARREVLPFASWARPSPGLASGVSSLVFTLNMMAGRTRSGNCSTPNLARVGRLRQRGGLGGGYVALS